MTKNELVDYINSTAGRSFEKKSRTLEEALQQALDMTTIERPGDPREHPDRKEERGIDRNEWI